jgi:hypothetical protein
MLKMAGLDVLFAAMGGLYFLLALAGICFALWIGKTRTLKLVYAVIVLALFISPVAPEMYRAIEYRGKFAAAQALFEERCKTAGEKVYRTVDSVEGVLLLNVRDRDRGRDRANPLWSDAALPDEFGGEGYIRTFLLWEHLQPGQPERDSNRASRSYLNPTPTSLPGYRFVDVKQADGAVVRYRLKRPENRDSVELSTEFVKGAPARYAVGFLNQIKLDDRAHWIAKTLITVTDTQTNEVIATRESYSFEPGLGSEAGGRQPWGFAKVCPESGRGNSPTRFFVDQVLKPVKGE